MATINGSGGSDTITTTVNTVPGEPLATSGSDTINAGGGNDMIQSGGGDDVITGGAGDDIINAQTGSGDVAVYSGSWKDYTITYNSGSGTYTVVDNRGGSPDGTDTLTNVETIQFSDVAAGLTGGEFAQALNDGPVIVSAAARTATEDTPLVMSPASLVSDADAPLGDTISITFPGPAPVNGTVSLDLSGNVVFTPTPDASGVGSFTYTATDAKGLSVTQTVTVNIGAVNDAPVNTLPGPMPPMKTSR